MNSPLDTRNGTTIVYDIARRIDPQNEGVLDFSPMWVAMIVRLRRPLTYDRVARRSRSADGTESAQERGKPLIITDITNMTVMRSKESPLKSATLSLPPSSEVDYLTQIFPGDWILLWMVDNQKDGQALLEALHRGDAVNDFYSGLKFVGRVKTRGKSGSRTGTPPKPVTHFEITASGFTEMDASLYWDTYLANSADQDMNTWMHKMGIAVNKFLTSNGIDINGAIPEMFEILFGRGISHHLANPVGAPTTQAVTGLTEGRGDAPFAFVVPETVGRVLGRQGRSKASGVLAAADLWTLLQGVQRYGQATEANISEPEAVGKTSSFSGAASLWPTSLQRQMGSFPVSVPDMSGKTNWSILHTFLNPTINELYTALKAGPDGQIVPTLVCRQLPFSTPLLLEEDKPVTRYLDLPRWVLHPAQVQDFKLVSTDALRVNFVHLTGFTSFQADNYAITRQLVDPKSAPLRDDQDIQRSGLQPEIAQIACGIRDLNNPLSGPGAWTAIRADIVMGQHLALTGTLVCFGVQEPICEGDNIEFDGIVLHIESISDTCLQSENGSKQWITVLQVSHGMAAAAGADSFDTLQANQLRLYPGTGVRPDVRELTSFDVGDTHDSQDHNADAASGFENAMVEMNFDEIVNPAEGPTGATAAAAGGPGLGRIPQ